MKRAMFPTFFAVVATILVAQPAFAEVLGPCGRAKASNPATAETTQAQSQAVVVQAQSRIPLPGEKAPNFSLPAVMADGSAKEVKLSDYAGKWRVVCFYPADNTFVCPTEIAAVAEKYEDLTKMDVEVISISTDSIFSHIQWKKTSPTVSKVKFPMAADSNHAVSKAYGVYNEHEGMDKRGRFIIDPEGTIMAVEVMWDPVGRNVDELIRQIQAMQAVVKSGGKAAPAGWKPGDELMTTKIPEDVGRY